MATDIMNDKLSIKNLLFVKAIPNYVLPIYAKNYKTFMCTDCGDKFILESSYEDHINRQSVQITYMCRHCKKYVWFFNRCNLLSHIRSHAFKTATINVFDLKVEPLPLSCYDENALQMAQNSLAEQKETTVVETVKGITCYECKEDISQTAVACKDRAKHFMQYTNQIYSCPVCLFALPTICGLKAHLRIHLKMIPFYCPECGILLTPKVTFYPYSHDCDGFKMMRATFRLKCPVEHCHMLIHINEFKDHMKVRHLKKVFKCTECVVACYNEQTMLKHLETHHLNDAKAMVFYQCSLCPGRLVLQNQTTNHLSTHFNGQPWYPCWTCGARYKELYKLLHHHVQTHCSTSDPLRDILNSFDTPKTPNKEKGIFRVIKRCDKCQRNFTYKCKYDQIGILPTECPYKCKYSVTEKTDGQIICHLCNNKISTNWEEIKVHYAEFHKEYKCLDINVNVERLDLKKYKLKGKRNKVNLSSINKRKSIKNKSAKSQKDFKNGTSTSTQFICNKCGESLETKTALETHIIEMHRDPCMAYQCLECGLCFVVKRSFATHLLLEHDISNTEEYITNKQCYNVNALEKYQNEKVIEEPLRENQCKICRAQFENMDDLEKHFRVHGMAFLMSTTSKNNSP